MVSLLSPISEHVPNKNNDFFRRAFRRILTPITASIGLGAAIIGGISYNESQNAKEELNQAKVTFQKNLSDKEQTFYARLELERKHTKDESDKKFGELKEIFSSRLEQSQNTINNLSERLDDSETNNRDLNQKLSDSQQMLQQLSGTVESTSQDLKAKLIATKSLEQRKAEVLDKISGSVVMLSSDFMVAKGEKTVWAGVIIKDNNNVFYILTCGHVFNTPDFVEHLITVTLYNDGRYKDEAPSFKVLPSTLKNGNLPWLSHEEGDILFLPLTDEEVSTLPKEAGLKIADSTEKLKQGQPVVLIGNPDGLEDSVYWTNIAHPYRIVRTNDESPAQQQMQIAMQIPKGMSGGPVINLNGEVVGITEWTYTKEPIGFALNVNGIKEYAENFGIPLITNNEVLKRVKDSSPLFLLLGQTPISSLLTNVPLIKLAFE